MYRGRRAKGGWVSRDRSDTRKAPVRCMDGLKGLERINQASSVVRARSKSPPWIWVWAGKTQVMNDMAWSLLALAMTKRAGCITVSQSCRRIGVRIHGRMESSAIPIEQGLASGLGNMGGGISVRVATWGWKGGRVVMPCVIQARRECLIGRIPACKGKRRKGKKGSIFQGCGRAERQ